MRFTLPPVLALLLAPLAPGAPPKVPATVKVKPGQITSVEIESEDGKEIAWAPGFAPEACYVDEGKPLRKNTARLIVSPYLPQVLRVVCWTVGEKDFSTLVIDASSTDPAPPVVPPVPPNPPVVDPLAKSITDVWSLNKEPDRRERTRALAAVMKSGASLSADVTVLTNAALVTKVNAATKDKVGDSLLDVRRAIGAHMNANFPTDSVTLTPELRTKFAASYLKIAQILEGLAP